VLVQLILGVLFIVFTLILLVCILFAQLETNQKARKIMAILDEMATEVHQMTGLKASIKAAFDGISAKLAAMASAPVVDPAELAALAAELHSDNTDFAAIITANTPADPVQVAATSGATSSAAPPVTPAPTVLVNALAPAAPPVTDPNAPQA